MGYFSNNTASKHGRSIYSTAILPCLYGGNDVMEIFCWTNERDSEHWIYENSNCSDQIHTQPQQFTLWNSTDLSSPIDAYPGHGFHLPLDAWDDLDHNVTDDSVYYAFVDEDTNAEVKPGYTYVASNYIRITGEPSNNLMLVMQTEGSRIIHVSLNLTLKMCPPGFDQAYDYGVKTTECICSENDYLGHIKCLTQEFKSQIDTKYWYGLVDVDSNETYLMGYIPLYFASNIHRINSTSSFIDLPGDPSKVGEFLCERLNRTGVLCGECLPDYAVAVNSPTYECVLCNDTNPAKLAGFSVAYILLTYGPITVLFSVIVLCNLNLASSAAAGFVLYAQIISSEFFDITAYQLSYLGVGGVSKQFQNVYTAIYGILNLKSFSFLMDPFCLINSNSFNILSVLCLDYAIAFYPIIVIFAVHLAYCCSCYKCKQWCQSRWLCQGCQKSSRAQNSVPRNRWANAFVAFMILSYSKFGLASMKTLLSNELFNAAGETKVYRVYLAGELSYPADGGYLGYAIFAIFIAVFFVFLPPLLLLGIIDLINWLTGKVECLRRIWCGDKVHIYLNAFVGYKTNRRWFAGVYLLFRLIMFIIYCFTPTIFLQYFLQQISILSLLLLVALLRPYDTDFYNYWDSFLLFNLGILNLIGMYMFVSGFSHGLYVAEGVLVLIPLALFITGYLFRIWYFKYGKNQRATSSLFEFIRLNDPLPSVSDIMPNEQTSLLDSRAEERNRYKPATPTDIPVTYVDGPK